MVPSLDVAWMEASLTAREALAYVVETSHERYPVARESLDHFVGIVHFRDLLASPDAEVGSLARPGLVVPMTKDLGALLRDLREQRQQMAIVADEYGGTAGIVTMHDVLEELVGEIENEFDLPSSEVERVDEHTVRVAGSMTIDDFNEVDRRDAPAARPAHARRARLRRARAPSGGGRRGARRRRGDPHRGGRRPAHHRGFASPFQPAL